MTLAFPASFEESNVGKKELIERWILSSIDHSHLSKGLPVCLKGSTSFYHIELPDLESCEPDFKRRVYTALVDEDVRDDLERAGLINWCPNVQKVIPLCVPRDGNCLLHSVALVIWGIRDTTLTMRHVLGLALGVDRGKRFHGRWRHYQQVQLSHLLERPLDSDPEHINKEWTEITQCLDPHYSCSRATPHRFLEAIHVYALANVLRRPIIIVTDPTMRTFSGLSLQDNDMGGIYLPLEWNWEDTCRTPVVLAYSSCHFSPIVLTRNTSQRTGDSLFPLVNRCMQQLPVRFLLEGEGPEVAALLRRYLKIRETVMQVDGQLQNILCTELKPLTLSNELNLVKDYFQFCQLQFQQEANSFSRWLSQGPAGVSLEPGQWRQEVTNQPVNFVENPTFGTPQHVEREQLQRMQNSEYSLADPTLSCSGLWGQSQVHVPPPSFTPRVSILQQNASLNPSLDKKCVVPDCKYFGDPEQGMMCSNCFRKYTIKESRQMAASRAVRSTPSAPMPSMQAEEQPVQLSMMAERCHDGCGLRCSTSTYPYCHECAEKRQKLHQQMAAVRASEAANSPPVMSGSIPRTTGAVSPAVLSSEPPQEGQKVHVNSLNDLNRPQGAQTAGSQLSLITSGNTPQRTVEPSQAFVTSAQSPLITDVLTPQKSVESSAAVVTSPAVENTENMSPTQVLAAGSLSAPLTPPDDNDKVLFGSGQPSPPANNPPVNPMIQSQALISPSQYQSHVDPATSQPLNPPKERDDEQPFFSLPSVSQPVQQPPAVVGQGQGMLAPTPYLTESQLAAGVSGIPEESHPEQCCKKGCCEEALLQRLCGKCYISQGMNSSGLDNPTVQKLKITSLCSTSSSAPASVGASAVAAKTSSPHTQETETALPPYRRNRASSLTLIQTSTGQLSHLNYVQKWVNENSSIKRNEEAGQGVPLGLPEKQETELPGHDLVESGHDCYSAPRCIGEGCRNSVDKEGALCEQCRSVLRNFRQGPQQSSSIQESQPDLQPCQTEGCPFFGHKDALNFCSSCYARLLKRQWQEEMRHTGPPNARRTFPLAWANSAHAQPISSSVARANSALAQPISSSVAHGQQSQLCSISGCRYYGDPKQKGMCGRHFMEHVTSFAAPVSHSAPIASQRAESQKHGNPSTQGAYALTQHSTQHQHHVTGTLAPSGFGTSQQNPANIKVPATMIPYKSDPSYVPPREGRPSPGMAYVTGLSASSQAVWGVPSTVEEPSLGETYNRVAGHLAVKCLNPICGNFGNPQKGGVCNSCAENESLTNYLIYGEEQIG